MKGPAPYFLLIIPIGILAAVLVLLFVRFFDPGGSLLGFLFMGARPGFSRLPLYIGVALIPIIAGILMGAAIFILVKREERKYEQMLSDAGEAACKEIFRCRDSLDVSIVRLRNTSKKMRRYAEELTALSARAGKSLETPGLKVEAAETRTVTLENNTVTDLRFIRTVDGLIPPGLFLLPQSHQKI
jgi:hypothetical protein